MTTLTLNYSTKIYSFTLKPVFKFLKGFFKSLGASIALSRQISANEQIVPYLLKEYPMHTHSSLLHELNMKALAAHNQRMDEDK